MPELEDTTGQVRRTGRVLAIEAHQSGHSPNNRQIRETIRGGDTG